MYMPGPDFLKQKYPELVGSKTAEKSVRNLPGPERQKAAKRIEAFLKRLETATSDDGKFELFSRKISESFIVPLRTIDGKEDIKRTGSLALGLYESEKQIARDRGLQGETARLESMHRNEIMRHYTDAVYDKVEEQRASLTEWLTYLNTEEAYEDRMWFKYYVVRSLRKMGLLDKERKTYSHRTDTTLAPFPELNREALALVYDLLVAHLEKNADKIKSATPHHEEWQKLLSGTDFATLYAHALFETGERESAETISGEWKLYRNTS